MGKRRERKQRPLTVEEERAACLQACKKAFANVNIEQWTAYSQLVKQFDQKLVDECCDKLCSGT